MAPRVGLKNLVAWKITKDDTTGLTYGEKFVIAKAIKAELKPKKTEAELHADDALAEYVSSVASYDVSLNVDDLTPTVQAKLLGYKTDSNGMIERDPNAQAPYVAIAFMSERSDGKYSYHNLLKVRFEAPDDAFETKGDSTKFQTPTITGKAMPTTYTGKFGYDVIGTEENKADVADKWFGTTPVMALKG